MNNNVSRISYLAIVLALVAAAAVSSVWYSPLLFGKQWMELRSLNSAGVADTAMPGWKILVDLVREFVVVYVLARFVSRLGRRLERYAESWILGVAWLSGTDACGLQSVDNKPWMLDLIHAGLMLLMALILTKGRRVQIAQLQTSS